ncbi:hypothetical protein ACFFTN_26575 [Aminobacter aganoensis]|uniref:NAD(P)-dependent dehydrogenase (Short-subunit alcohol dehydrogenase family) n=1 Tax=Aminobacter aganoensis TaxID=83264 RepID=A0A7X0FD03_9HYPH|nr:hypothetical protein [Aminobacter aganoensis]MBB6357486.1 NAD(P)-dependent dehydrogenase (short-subunit alcohol dehydrogenase family) [Aminobacter aganoensis]
MDLIFRINVDGVLWGIQAAAKKFKDRGQKGKTINACAIAVGVLLRRLQRAAASVRRPRLAMPFSHGRWFVHWTGKADSPI